MKAAKSVRANCANLFEIESYLSERIFFLADFKNLKFDLTQYNLITPSQLIKYFDNAARIQVYFKY